MRELALAFLACIALSGCVGTTLQGIPPQIEQIAGAPTMICTGLLAQEATSLAQLKAALAATP